MSEVDVQVDTADWWACVDYPHLLDPSRVERVEPRHVEGVGWVLAADTVTHLSVTLAGSHLTEREARRRAAELVAGE